MTIEDAILQRIEDNTPRGLNLTNKGLDGQDVAAVAKALTKNTSVTSLAIAGNHIDDAGAQALADMLRSNRTIKEISLGSNRIGDEGAKAIAEALRDNHTLRELSLSRNRIGDEGVAAIASALADNNTLSSLALDVNRISDAGTEALAHGLKGNSTLIELSLHSNAITSQGAFALAQWVSSHPHLTSLDVGHNPIGIEGEERLAQAAVSSANPNLVQLQMGYSPPPALSNFIDQNVRTLSVLSQRLQEGASQLTGEELRRIDKHLPSVLRTQYYANRASYSGHGAVQKEARYEAFLDTLPGLPPTGPDFAEALFTPNTQGFTPLDNPRLWKDQEIALNTLNQLGQDTTLLSRRTAKGSTLLDSVAAATSAHAQIKGPSQQAASTERTVVGEHTARLQKQSPHPQSTTLQL